MNLNFKILLTLTICTVPLMLAKTVQAQTVLREAVIETVENRVNLIPKNQQARSARTSDRMTPGDALATAARSKADLRFNEGSWARLGEQAVFRFVSGTRNVDLTNGTALLLIPPGQGKTQIRTPNAAAGIRGSALFVRYIPETDTTVIGALTDSGITVYNENAAQGITLKGGQMAQIVQGNIENIYEFDVRTFIETSPLVNDLGLTEDGVLSEVNNPLNEVKKEIASAIAAQAPFTDQEMIIENPDFVRLPDNNSNDFPDLNAQVVTIDVTALPDQTVLERMEGIVQTSSLREAGEIRATEARRNDNLVGGGDFPGGGATGGDFPGGGATDGNFPGGGATDGIKLENLANELHYPQNPDF
jgi:hypothetical protein